MSTKVLDAELAECSTRVYQYGLPGNQVQEINFDNLIKTFSNVSDFTKDFVLCPHDKKRLTVSFDRTIKTSV
jgi:hypothetical protein